MIIIHQCQLQRLIPQYGTARSSDINLLLAPPVLGILQILTRAIATRASALVLKALQVGVIDVACTRIEQSAVTAWIYNCGSGGGSKLWILVQVIHTCAVISVEA